MSESTWKILKLDWKTPGIFFFQKSENPAIYVGHYTKHQISLVIGPRKSWFLNSVTVHNSISADINCAFVLECSNCSLHAAVWAALSSPAKYSAWTVLAVWAGFTHSGLNWQVPGFVLESWEWDFLGIDIPIPHRTTSSGPIRCLLHLNSYSVPKLVYFCAANFLLTEYDEWWKNAFKKESQKSEFDVSVSENMSDFGFAKNCGIPTKFGFEFELLHVPVNKQPRVGPGV